MPKKRFRTLSDIYAAIPEVKCQGKCANACTIIPMSQVERTRIRAQGVTIPLVQVGMDLTAPCPALKFKRCTVYADRPVICRLYGATEDLLCPYDCEVSGPLLTVEEAHELLDAARAIGMGTTVRRKKK